MKSDFKIKMGHYIQQERLKKGWTQKHLGELIGKDHTMISYYETGKNEPSAPTMRKLSKLFGCSINKLFPDA